MPRRHSTNPRLHWVILPYISVNLQTDNLTPDSDQSIEGKIPLTVVLLMQTFELKQQFWTSVYSFLRELWVIYTCPVSTNLPCDFVEDIQCSFVSTTFWNWFTASSYSCAWWRISQIWKDLHKQINRIM